MRRAVRAPDLLAPILLAAACGGAPDLPEGAAPVSTGHVAWFLVSALQADGEEFDLFAGNDPDSRPAAVLFMLVQARDGELVPWSPTDASGAGSSLTLSGDLEYAGLDVPEGSIPLHGTMSLEGGTTVRMRSDLRYDLLGISLSVELDTTFADDPAAGRESTLVLRTPDDERVLTAWFWSVTDQRDDAGMSYDFRYFLAGDPDGAAAFGEEGGEPVRGVHFCDAPGCSPLGWLGS